jgi:hypothetical protein
MLYFQYNILMDDDDRSTLQSDTNEGLIGLTITTTTITTTTMTSTATVGTSMTTTATAITNTLLSPSDHRRQSQYHRNG